MEIVDCKPNRGNLNQCNVEVKAMFYHFVQEGNLLFVLTLKNKIKYLVSRHSKCKKRYVQPERARNYAPESKYCPPTNPVEGKTTYLLSYMNDGTYTVKPQQIRPVNELKRINCKMPNVTTTRMSYQPILVPDRARPCVPKRR